LSVVEVGGMTGGRKIPSWECELWFHITRGDGSECPLYEHCLLKQKGDWCASDSKELLDQLFNDGQSCLSNYDCVERLTSGRIFKLVEKLAQRFLTKGKVCSPPVPKELITLFDQHPVDVREVPLRAYQGAIWRLRDGWVVYLNRNDVHGRKRFTLFHEAFHILAHRRATPVFRRYGCEKGTFNEFLAEYFASCILMPQKWVMEKWAEVGDLASMAEIFVVPKPAMWLRLRQLNLI